MRHSTQIKTSKRSVVASFVIILLLGSLFVSHGRELGTVAYFTDVETSTANLLRAGEWGETPQLFRVFLSEMTVTVSDEPLPPLEEVETPLEEGIVAGVEDEVVEEEVPQTETPVTEETQTPPTEESVEETPVVEDIQPEPTVEDEETPLEAVQVIEPMLEPTSEL